MSLIDQEALQGLIQNEPVEPSYNYKNNSSCAEIECYNKALYNFPGRPPKYCAEHITIGMKAQPRRKCVGKDCADFAIYSHVKHRTIWGVYCKLHKPAKKYVLVTRRTCNNCKKLMPILVKGLCGHCGRQTIRLKIKC